VDALLEAARATGDVAKRRDLYGQMWQIVQVEDPFVFLWTMRNIAGMKASVTGYRSLPDGLVRLQGVSITQQGRRGDAPARNGRASGVSRRSARFHPNPAAATPPSLLTARSTTVSTRRRWTTTQGELPGSV
jgi:hypothetical protein